LKEWQVQRVIEKVHSAIHWPQSGDDPADVKRWLAASLAKTIGLQLDPPPELRAMSALAGPDWIRQPRSG